MTTRRLDPVDFVHNPLRRPPQLHLVDGQRVLRLRPQAVRRGRELTNGMPSSASLRVPRSAALSRPRRGDIERVSPCLRLRSIAQASVVLRSGDSFDEIPPARHAPTARRRAGDPVARRQVLECGEGGIVISTHYVSARYIDCHGFARHTRSPPLDSFARSSRPKRERPAGGRVSTRVPPTERYLHRHSIVCLNFVRARFSGTCNLRCDDTIRTGTSSTSVDPGDVRWVGFSWKTLFYASDYFHLYDCAETSFGTARRTWTISRRTRSASTAAR